MRQSVKRDHQGREDDRRSHQPGDRTDEDRHRWVAERGPAGRVERHPAQARAGSRRRSSTCSSHPKCCPPPTGAGRSPGGCRARPNRGRGRRPAGCRCRHRGTRRTRHAEPCPVVHRSPDGEFLPPPGTARRSPPSGRRERCRPAAALPSATVAATSTAAYMRPQPRRVKHGAAHPDRHQDRGHRTPRRDQRQRHLDQRSSSPQQAHPSRARDDSP